MNEVALLWVRCMFLIFCPRGINDLAISSGGVLHVEAVSNCSMIDLFMSQFQGAGQLRPRAAPFGFYEVL